MAVLFKQASPQKTALGQPQFKGLVTPPEDGFGTGLIDPKYPNQTIRFAVTRSAVFKTVESQ